MKILIFVAVFVAAANAQFQWVRVAPIVEQPQKPVQPRFNPYQEYFTASYNKVGYPGQQGEDSEEQQPQPNIPFQVQFPNSENFQMRYPNPEDSAVPKFIIVPQQIPSRAAPAAPAKIEAPFQRLMVLPQENYPQNYVIIPKAPEQQNVPDNSVFIHPLKDVFRFNPALRPREHIPY